MDFKTQKQPNSNGKSSYNILNMYRCTSGPSSSRAPFALTSYMMNNWLCCFFFIFIFSIRLFYFTFFKFVTSEYPSSITLYIFPSILYFEMHLRHFLPLCHILYISLGSIFFRCVHFIYVFLNQRKQFSTLVAGCLSVNTPCDCCCVLTLSLSRLSIRLWCPMVLTALVVESLLWSPLGSPRSQIM